MKITRPIMAGKLNILEASDDELIEVIRHCNNEIAINTDISGMSTKYQEIEIDLRIVIAECLKQLDLEY
jgi:hypothetical protein